MRHLGEALDHVRKSEYGRLAGRDRRYIKGQKYTLLSRKENLTLDGKKALKTLLAANKRLNAGQLWSYEREGWARRFFENWRASLKWQRAISKILKPITPSRAGGLKGNRQRRLQRILGQELGLHEDGSFSCN